MKSALVGAAVICHQLNERTEKFREEILNSLHGEDIRKRIEVLMKLLSLDNSVNRRKFFSHTIYSALEIEMAEGIAIPTQDQIRHAMATAEVLRAHLVKEYISMGRGSGQKIPLPGLSSIFDSA